MYFSGDATSDEMCSAIVTYYPEQNGANYCSMIENVSDNKVIIRVI